MRFEHVGLAVIAVTLPEERLTSSAIESQLAPVYERLRLPPGRLELMSGIFERRCFPSGTWPGVVSIATADAALNSIPLERRDVGCLIHASVCRDFLEPATASRVHAGLGLSTDCWVYDLSNACLGLLNGAVQIAHLIEHQVISAGIVVGTEQSRPLLETTIASLLADQSLTRQSIKPAFASLTIGSASCAWVLVDRRRWPNTSRLEVAVARADTQHFGLCASESDQAGEAMAPLMETDAEALLEAGLQTGAANFETLTSQAGWSRAEIDRTVCHQVGSRHRAQMLERFQLGRERDSITYPWLGNTGSVALPVTLAAAARYGQVQSNDAVALLGIGSGINSVMLGVRWGETAIAGNLPETDPLRTGPSPADVDGG
jgi:3-oxoacyl-[acyl-carrier-protein] synthase-3